MQVQVQLQHYRYTRQILRRQYRTREAKVAHSQEFQHNIKIKLDHSASNTGDSENQKLRDNVVGSNEIENYARLLANSFYKETGQNLVEQKENIAQQIWDADYGLLAHSTNVEPYVFVYANQTAFKEFRCTWDEIIGKPSYTSADEAGQTDRYKFIEEAFKNGYAVRYNIKRTSPATGAYVTIENSLLFNVKDANGHIVGQAAKLEGFKK